ncbi:MAG: FAD-linked oxidase C-terminal domain-containing protein [Planctomycetota bacterium]
MNTPNLHPPSATQVDAFEQALRQRVRGEISRDRFRRGIYATDASHYQITPAIVVIPRDEADVIAAVTTAGEHGVPITPRGGGTSLSGQTSWTGMVIDFSKYFDEILEINAEERWVRVQPGVVRDHLNALLKPLGLHFAPDPATSSRANVGGMIGNNTAGTHSVLYGKTIDHVDACKVVLTDGTVCEFAATTSEEWAQRAVGDDRESQLYREVQRIVDSNAEEIDRRFPKVMRRVGGYNLDAFLPEARGGQSGDWNLTHLIVGSEGTLATVLEATLRLEPLPKTTGLCVVHFDDFIEAMAAVDTMLEFQPAAIEVLDDKVMHEARRNPTTAALSDFIEGEPQAIQIVEFFGETTEEVERQAAAMVNVLKEKGLGYSWPIRTDPAGQARVWDVRRLGLGLIGNLPGARKGQAFIEDACVPTKHLAEYVQRVLTLCEQKQVPVVSYAHASVGVIHIRPMLDMHNQADVNLMREIANETFEIVKEYGGSWSGEHGDGIVRGEFLPRFFGPEVYRALCEVKELFDPQGIMNPGKIISAAKMTDNLRFGSQYQLQQIQPTYHYRDHGSFDLLVEQCSGVGACRKQGSGTMCPSYMATRDEEHTVRGRANALRLAMSGQLGKHALTDDRMMEVLSLCLSCKACKSECPTLVDMARLKADVLQMRYQQQGTPLSARLLGSIATKARQVAGPLAPLANRLQSFGPFKAMLEKLAKIDRRRALPAYASETLVSWFKMRPTMDSDRPSVALFNDTFTNCFEPRLGKAAVRLLQGCGYQVELADVGCCQRPAISQGLLHQAKAAGTQTLMALDAYARRGVPVLVLEPSCASALVDDLVDLADDRDMAERVAANIKMIDVFLADELSAGRLDAELYSPFEALMIHGHCHQKALFGTDSMKTILRETGVRFEEIDSGCCGMAGAFGYQHHDLSEQIGEDRLFPAVRSRAPHTEVVACGISCRHQLHDFLQVEAKHWVEVVEARPRNAGVADTPGASPAVQAVEE